MNRSVMSLAVILGLLVVSGAIAVIRPLQGSKSTAVGKPQPYWQLTGR